MPAEPENPTPPAVPDTVAGIAAAVRAGTLRPEAPTLAALRRIADRDAGIGAFSRVRADAARAEAAALAERGDLADLPLAGVPISLKENIGPEHPVTRRLVDAGAIVVGSTATPELCIWGITDGAAGTVRNPWNTGHTAGGSSGGAAASVAAAMVPAAHGNDGMGSLRIPAADCGLVTIKPGRDVVPSLLGAHAWFGMAENGPLTTTVEDAALLLGVMADDPAYAELRAPEPQVIALCVNSPMPGVGPLQAAPVRPEWADAARRAADILAGAGHTSIDSRFPYGPNPLPLLARWTAGALDDAREAGLPWRSLEPRNRVHTGLGKVLRPLAHERFAQSLRTRVERFFDSGYDVVVTPTLADSAPLAGDWHRRSWPRNLWANLRYAPFPSTWNLLGWPAVSVPMGVAANGLPVGAQIAGRPGSEATLLGLAAQIEAASPWRRHPEAYRD